MKLPVKLVGLEAYQDIKYYLFKAMHESMTVEEFEESWNNTITSYHLEENEWLANLYEKRKRWVPAFLINYENILWLSTYYCTYFWKLT